MIGGVSLFGAFLRGADETGTLSGSLLTASGCGLVGTVVEVGDFVGERGVVMTGDVLCADSIDCWLVLELEPNTELEVDPDTDGMGYLGEEGVVSRVANLVGGALELTTGFFSFSASLPLWLWPGVKVAVEETIWPWCLCFFCFASLTSAMISFIPY